MATQLNAFPEVIQAEPNKVVVTTSQRFESLIRFLETRKALVIDYETSGLEWFKQAEAVGMGLGAWDDSGQLWNAYVPFRHRTGEAQLDLSIIGLAFKRLLENPNILKIGHNIKFEDHFSRREDWKIQGPRYDTMVACRLYNENLPGELEFRAERDLGIADARRWEHRLNQTIHDLAKLNRLGVKAYLKKYGYAETPIHLCGQYCCTDTDHTGMLKVFYEKWGLSQRYPRIWPTEMRLTEILCDMEEHGLPIDLLYLQTVKAEVQVAKAELEIQIKQALGGYTLNLGSDDEVRHLLSHVMGLKWDKRTDGNQLAVDREVLSYFATTNVVCQLLMKWRDAEKLDTTYTDSIIKMLDSKGLLHGNLKSVGTNTGRLSCTSPNYQNFPTDDDDRARAFSGKKVEDGGIDPWSIRRAFPVRGPGWVRVFLDYSQIELRVLAYYSRDPVMVDTYLHGQDIHERTAKEVGAMLGRECPRRVAKVVNFGISYCLSEGGLSRQAKISEDDARAFMAAFFQRYSGVATFRMELWAQARRQHNQWNNIFGRTRRLPDLRSEEFWKAKRAERQMIGSAIQGTAAELTKESLVRLDDWIKRSGTPALLVNTVHDEIQIDTPRECLPLVVRECKKLMEAFPEFAPIPIIADADWTDKTWADKHEYEESDHG